MTQEPTLLTTSEVARRLRVDAATVRRWCIDGQIAHVRLPSGVYRFYPADIDDLTRPSTRTA
jgi:excisionase family DNA binding protein